MKNSQVCSIQIEEIADESITSTLLQINQDVVLVRIVGF